MSVDRKFHLRLVRSADRVCVQMTTKGLRSDSTAEALFTSKARLAVLKLVVLNAGEQFYLREIAARTHLPVRAVQRELARLEAAGLLTARADDNRESYQASGQSPVFYDLRALLLKTVGLGDLLRNQLAGARPEILSAFLFGTYARGSDSTSSDIDLMIIGSTTGRSLARLLAPAREALGREINPVVMSRAEFRRKIAEGNPFVLSVLREPKIFLIGGKMSLQRFLKEGHLRRHRTSRKEIRPSSGRPPRPGGRFSARPIGR